VRRHEEEEYPEIDVEVHWVTERTKFTTFKSHFVTYGNEPGLEYTYGRLSLIVEVGPAGDRKNPVLFKSLKKNND